MGARVMGQPRTMPTGSSPDVRAFLRRNVHRAVGRDSERLVPRFDVAQRPEDPEPARAMRVGRDLAAQRILALLLAPYLGVGEEETLIAGQPVKRRCRLSAERAVISIERHLHAGE